MDIAQFLGWEWKSCLIDEVYNNNSILLQSNIWIKTYVLNSQNKLEIQILL